MSHLLPFRYRPCSFRGILNLLREGDRHERVSGSGSYRTRNPKASALSDRFEELYRKHLDSWAYEQFKNVDAAPDKTFDTIRSVLVSKFSNYGTKEIDEMTSSNEIDFSELSGKKTIRCFPGLHISARLRLKLLPDRLPVHVFVQRAFFGAADLDIIPDPDKLRI